MPGEGCFWRCLWGRCSRNGTSDFSVLLKWEKELKGISSSSSQQRELLALAGDRSLRSWEVLQLFRAHIQGSSSLHWGSHVLRWQEVFASSQTCFILQIRVHEADTKPCLVLGRVMGTLAASLKHLLHQDGSLFLNTHTSL